MSQSESLRASPLALDPYNIALLPEGIADLAISFIFNMVLSSGDISLIFYNGKDMVKKRKRQTFLPKIILFFWLFMRKVVLPCALS